ncbi:MAG: DegT/DnrJ/EryC1/StrS family aminotransferase [Acidobacteria bacterium]|nr:DegT/DnrJ/EryC1/StrS family aminotransferase [Acidobacteriota bacterium]
MWRVPLFELNYDEAETNAVLGVINSRWLTMGDRVVEFESSFANYLGGGVSAVAVSNGTAALHMSLLAADVRPGDEVLVPALTFVADANVVSLVGAVPVFVDCVSLDDWNMDPRDAAAKVTAKTSAAIVVHYAGFPADIPALRRAIDDAAATKRPGKPAICLVEDVAHAPGATIGDRKCGTVGDIGCFSFFSNKNLSVGEGGMVVTANESLLQRSKLLRSHGMSSLTLDRHRGRATTYGVSMPGLNYRIDEIRAALGIEQLKKLDRGNARRAALVQRYRKNLTSAPHVSVPFASVDPKRSTHHIMPVLLPVGVAREQVMAEMKEAGIQSSIHYPSFASFDAYRELASGKAPRAEEICARELTLPLYPTMTDEHCDLVCDVLIRALHR